MLSYSPFQSPNQNLQPNLKPCQIVNSEWEWVFKWTFDECESFKNNALNSNKMSKSKVKKWLIVSNT